MVPLRAFAASQLVIGLLAGTLHTALAASVYVVDGAHMLKPETVAAVEARDAQLQARTGKAVTVVTVRTTGGMPVQAAAAAEGRKRMPSGALIYVARDDQQPYVVYGANVATLFSPALQTSIEQALRLSLHQGDYDDGLIAAVDAISGVIAGGASGAHGPSLPAPQGPAQAAPSGPFGVGWLWWVAIAIVVIFIVRVAVRRSAGPR
jgi:uncharacterized membrane protein YgcG